MKLYFERSRWVDTICLAVGFSWEDWHIRECRLWVDFCIWSLTINFRLGKKESK